MLLKPLLVSSLLLLSSCSLYLPTIPSTPLLQKGQVQVSAGLRGATSLEAGAAWAPTRHLLLSAESGFYNATITTTDRQGQATIYHNYHRQLSLGVGYYRAAPSGWYLAALGGAGVAGTFQYDRDFDPLIFLGGTLGGGSFRASYRRYYTQFYAAWPTADHRITNGFSLRTVYVDYTQLTLDGQPFDPNTHVFFEPTFFIKAGHGPVQVQGSVGLSVPLEANGDAFTGNRTSPTCSLLGVAIILRPDLLLKKQQ